MVSNGCEIDEHAISCELPRVAAVEIKEVFMRINALLGGGAIAQANRRLTIATSRS